MPQFVPTHINAFNADLAEAELEMQALKSKISDLKRTIAEREGIKESEVVTPELALPPNKDADTKDSIPVVLKDADHQKPLSKMNRNELNAKATELGIDSPETLGTNKDVAKAIQKAEQNTDSEDKK